MPSGSDVIMQSRRGPQRSSLMMSKDHNRFAAASMRGGGGVRARNNRRSTVPRGDEENNTPDPDARGASIRRRHREFRMGFGAESDADRQRFGAEAESRPLNGGGTADP